MSNRPTPTILPHSRRPLVGTSLKMYFDPSQTQSYLESLLPLGQLAKHLNVDVFVIPDFLSISKAKEILNLEPTKPSTSSDEENNSQQGLSSARSASGVLLGAQNCFWQPSGAYTGEVSPQHLAHFGVSLVELGHAERRRLFYETSDTTALKALASCSAGLVPLVCIGELNQGTVDEAVEEVRPQIESLLEAIPGASEVVLAYEPVWAIGQAEPAGAEYVVEVTKKLRVIAEGFVKKEGEGAGERRTGCVRLLYGGSAGPGLFGKLKEGVDGLFLGRFAHDVRNLEKVMRELVA